MDGLPTGVIPKPSGPEGRGMSNDSHILRTSFVLAVPDIERATRYWCDVLGFRLQFSNEGWRFVGRDICRVMLGECPDAIAPAELGNHSYFGYIDVSDVDAYYAEISARGALVSAPPSDKSWGMREISVKTPDGHRIRFGQRLLST
jgi:catechol 2,3-dioxygenase-like lactoylglutathione lyase family enzyme